MVCQVPYSTDNWFMLQAFMEEISNTYYEILRRHSRLILVPRAGPLTLSYYIFLGVCALAGEGNGG